MRRRRLLATLGALGASGLAGCSNDDQAAGGGDTGTPSTDTPSTVAPAETTSTATVPPSDETTTSGSRPSASTPTLVTGEPTITRVELGHYSGPAAEVDLLNTGDVPARAVRLRLDWLDRDDDLIESGTKLVPTLAPGETFRARMTPSRIGTPSASRRSYRSSRGPRKRPPSWTPRG